MYFNCIFFFFIVDIVWFSFFLKICNIQPIDVINYHLSQYFKSRTIISADNFHRSFRYILYSDESGSIVESLWSRSIIGID